jgi:formylglycine-generating enzyme required for sulfatase activity
MTPSTSRRGSRAPSTLSGPLSTVRYTVNGVSFDMVRVPPGRFVDGEGETRRELLVSRPFELGVAPVTQALWRAVMDSSPSRFQGEDRPVETVSWNDAQQLMVALSKRGLPGFRLPTDAEWAWAARCGAPTWWAGADRAKAVAVVSSRQTAAVAGLSGPAVGAFDLSGNVWEWVGDWYGGFGQVPPAGVDVQGPASGSLRVRRGGSWSIDPQYARVAIRSSVDPGRRNGGLGVRLLRTAP